ncbi:gluconate 2-dehydrogenase subunit 3 family protein [Telmatobacter sp. DSM 110680]|uniref:Gluconate 2-dehydrogenase subunit 3 family protein n=1 Tax=Telmatobacter sp. DSM 110680 TaxID=3036704 RepID=A0AAU7DT59_9BACT
MLRRDFVRAVLAVGAAPKLLLSQQAATPATPLPAPVPWQLGLNPKTPIPHVVAADQLAVAELRFFSPEQMATLTRLSDFLMPPIGEKPGAVQAQTPMFLDFLIGDSPDARKRVYSEGLDWLDAEAKKKFNVEFAKLSDTQADELLKPWLRTWMSDNPPTEKHADFINIAHDEIRTATVNSKAWFAAPEVGSEPRTSVELYWSPIEPDVSFGDSDCAHVQPHVQAAPKSDHPMPSYPR